MVINTFSIDADGYVTHVQTHQAIEKHAEIAPGVNLMPVEAARMITHAYALIAQVTGPYRAEFGLSGARYGILRTLFEAEPEALSMGAIAESLTVPPPNVTQLAAGLARDGLIERTRDPNDRRVTRVRLTRAGRERLEMFAPHNARRLEEAFSGLGDDEQRLLIHLLAKWRMTLLAQVNARLPQSGRTVEPLEPGLVEPTARDGSVKTSTTKREGGS
jgi:DNA-binding MarR family transcriptional regulator